MRISRHVFFVLIAGIVCLSSFVGTASAESIIKAVYRVSLTDPATGNV